MIYIGKAGKGNAVFYESKRVNKCIKMLKDNGDIPENLSLDDSQEYVYRNCQRYVGAVSDEIQRSDQKNRLLENAERLLVFEVNKVIGLYNTHYVKKYRGESPFSVINNGDRPPGMEAQYSTSVHTEN